MGQTKNRSVADNDKCRQRHLSACFPRERPVRDFACLGLPKLVIFAILHQGHRVRVRARALSATRRRGANPPTQIETPTLSRGVLTYAAAAFAANPCSALTVVLAKLFLPWLHPFPDLCPFY
jgi:hypothetical protein